MKPSICLIVLVALLIGACSKKSDSTATLATPVKGMRVDEVMAAHNVAAEVIPARQSRQQDDGMQAINKQMAMVGSDLDARMRLLIANTGAKVTLSHGQTDSVGVLDPRVKQQLDANITDLLYHLAQARAAVDSVGAAHDMVAGLPAGSVRDGLRASLGRIQGEINEIAQAPHSKAIAEVADLRERMKLEPLRNSNPAAPTISIRVTH